MSNDYPNRADWLAIRSTPRGRKAIAAHRQNARSLPARQKLGKALNKFTRSARMNDIYAKYVTEHPELANLSRRELRAERDYRCSLERP